MKYEVPSSATSKASLATTATAVESIAENFTKVASRSRLPSMSQVKTAALKAITAPPRFVNNQWNKLTPNQKGSVALATVAGGFALGMTAFLGSGKLNQADHRKEHFEDIKDQLPAEEQEKGQKILDKEAGSNAISIHSNNVRDEYRAFLVENGISPYIYPGKMGMRS